MRDFFWKDARHESIKNHLQPFVGIYTDARGIQASLIKSSYIDCPEIFESLSTTLRNSRV